MYVRISRVVAGSIALAMLAAACGNDGEAGSTESAAQAGDSTDARGSPEGTVALHARTDLDTMDPRFTLSSGGKMINWFLYDRLLFIGPGGEFVPWRAEEWDVAPDGLSVEFTIREGVTCQDGTALTPTAIAKWIRAMEEPGMERPLRTIFSEDNLADVAAATMRAR